MLVLKFQGLEDQCYKLRQLYGHVFEWSLGYDDESKRRDKYNVTKLDFYLFKFELDVKGEAVVPLS